MRWLLFLPSVALTALVAACASPRGPEQSVETQRAPSSEAAAFLAAVQTNTRQSYMDFLVAHPSGTYSEQVIDLLTKCSETACPSGQDLENALTAARAAQAQASGAPAAAAAQSGGRRSGWSAAGRY